MTIEQFITELQKYPANMNIRVREILFDLEEREEYPADVNPVIKLYKKNGKEYVLIHGEFK